MLQSCCQHQRRRLADRRGAGRNVRPVVSATGLSLVLFTVSILWMCITWIHYESGKISDHENMYEIHESFERPGPPNTGGVNAQNRTNSVGIINEARNSKGTEGASTKDGASRLDLITHSKYETNHSLSQTFLKTIDWKSRLPETKEHLMRLSLSPEVDIEDLGMYLRNKSAYVYNRGPWDGAGIVIEDYKLVFFTQGKVACTVFKQLFRRMMNLSDWKKDKGDMPHHPGKNGLKYLYDYSVPDALTILTHPDWTRAIFVRDPKERTLSAFLDKAARKKGKYIRRHCCNTKNSTCGEEANASFLGFLNVVGRQCCCDPHWKRQSRRIDPVFMPFINFVGHFDRARLDSERLLKSLNSKALAAKFDDKSMDPWTKFGASGWGSHGNQSIFSKDTKAKHQTSAETKLKKYYNTTTEVLVEKLFAADYDDQTLDLTPYSLFYNEKK